MLDYLLENLKVVDGSGHNSYFANIGIKNECILIEPKTKSAHRVIDCQGKTIAPGFIDMHTHSDVSFVSDPLCSSKLFQGVTTEIVGCCGYSYYPSTLNGLNRLRPIITKQTSLVSESMIDFLEKSENYDKTINWGTYIGHGTLRSSVVGYAAVKATQDQMTTMKFLLDRELERGAYGLSLGIAYAPGMFTEIDEFIELGKVVAKHGRIITAHIRNENDKVFEAIEEMIEIGRVSKAHIHISHLKLGFGNWGKVSDLLDLIKKANKEGVKVTYELYPYVASATGLSVILPDWAHDGGVEKLLDRLKNEKDAIRKGIMASNSYRMGLERVVLVNTNGLFKEADGKNIKEISKLLGLSDVDTVIYLLEMSGGELPTIRFTMDPEDVSMLLADKDSVIISDGSAYSLNSQEVSGKPHPRSFGTFPRAIRLNRENKYMSLEQMIYKMTGMPAKLLKLKNRGFIKKDYYADLVIFDPDTICDQANYDDPFQKPLGIDYIFVNGRLVVENNLATENRPGVFL